MPNQVDGALLRAPCPVPSCPACEPNTGSVHPNLSAKAARVEASRHCYAIRWCTKTSSSAFTLSRDQRHILVAGAALSCAPQRLQTSLPWIAANGARRVTG